MKNVIALSVVLACLPAAGFAQEKPTPAEVKKVVEYYFNGKGHGAIPIEYKLCQEVSQQGETKNECVSELSNAKIEKGKDAYLWMNFLVPAGDEAKILLQYSRMDKVRETSNVSLAGATRYRTWKKIPTSTAGDWQVNIVQELESSDLEIGKLKFSVVEAQ